MKYRQPGLFDIEEERRNWTKMGDSLVGLKARIDWEAFRLTLNECMKKKEKVRQEPSRSMSC